VKFSSSAAGAGDHCAPAEVKWALRLLWLALIAGFIQSLQAATLSLPSFGIDTWAQWVSRFWAFPVSAIFLVALRHRYGWVRWWFVVSLVLMTFGLLVLLPQWHTLRIPERLGSLVYIEPVLAAIRVVAVVLLFRPAARVWFDRSSVPVPIP
jgi:hypothetical protein